MEEKMNTTQEAHLSYSQINTYLTCPLRYKFNYVDKIPAAFVSAALAFGTSIHESAGAFYQAKLEGDELKKDQMLDVFRQAWRQAGEVRYFNGKRSPGRRQKGWAW
jgi:hypothetical protein